MGIENSDPRAHPVLLGQLGDETLEWAGWVDDDGDDRRAAWFGLAAGGGMIALASIHLIPFGLGLVTNPAAATFQDTGLAIGLVLVCGFFAVPLIRQELRGLKRTDAAIWAVTDRRLLHVVFTPPGSNIETAQWLPAHIRKFHQRNIDGTPELIVHTNPPRGYGFPRRYPNALNLLIIKGPRDLDAAERAIAELTG